jgi:hypothetical protein
MLEYFRTVRLKNIKDLDLKDIMDLRKRICRSENGQPITTNTI